MQEPYWFQKRYKVVFSYQIHSGVFFHYFHSIRNTGTTLMPLTGTNILSWGLMRVAVGVPGGPHVQSLEQRTHWQILIGPFHQTLAVSVEERTVLGSNWVSRIGKRIPWKPYMETWAKQMRAAIPEAMECRSSSEARWRYWRSSWHDLGNADLTFLCGGFIIPHKKANWRPGVAFEKGQISKSWMCPQWWGRKFFRL